MKDEELDLDFWQEPIAVDIEVGFRVNADLVEDIVEKLKGHGLEPSAAIENLQEAIEYQVGNAIECGERKIRWNQVTRDLARIRDRRDIRTLKKTLVRNQYKQIVCQTSFYVKKVRRLVGPVERRMDAHAL